MCPCHLLGTACEYLIMAWLQQQPTRERLDTFMQLELSFAISRTLARTRRTIHFSQSLLSSSGCMLISAYIFFSRRFSSSSLHLADHRRVHAAIFGSPFVKGRRAHSMFPAKPGTGTPPSAWRRIARVCGSLNLPVFIKISSIIKPEKFYF